MLKTFLLMVGAFLAAIAIFVLLLVLWIWYKLRKWAKKFGDSLGEYAALGSAVPPFRVHLQPAEEPAWSHEEEVNQLASALEEAGFQRIGDFLADELPGVVLRAFTDPRRCLYAVVYDHFQVGVWFDLVSQYADGKTYTFTTAEPSGLRNPPFLVIEHHPGAEPQELLEHCLATRPAEKLERTPPQEFAARFEKAHAREMDWRAEQGGPSEEEIRAIAAKGGGEPDPETVEQIRDMWRYQRNEFYTEQLREAYLDQGRISARRWEEIRERLFFVHDRLTEADLLEQCETAVAAEMDESDWDANDDEDEDDEEDDAYEQELERRVEKFRGMIQGLPPRAAFAKINQTFPKKFRFERIGELRQPFPADVYLEPAGREED